MNWPNTDDITNVTDHQRQQAAGMFAGKLCVLSGGPGTGKTHTTAAILRSMLANKKQTPRIAVCAPTGKAAARITEAMDEHKLPIQARTIHSTLGPSRNGHDGDGWGFEYNRHNQLPVDLLVCDETSMVDVDLMAHLLAAVPAGCNVLLVGDPNQLAPVGHGKPFCDMIEAGTVPHGHLTEVHRFAGRIAHVCNAIRDSKPWTPSDPVDWKRKEQPENVKHIETKTAPASLGAMLKVIDRLADDGELNVVDDVQVLCAKNDAGDLSRKKLNQLLQQRLNPSGQKVDGNPFAVGDKIICTRNQSLPLDDNGSAGGMSGSVYVANGELGKVVDVDRNFFAATFGGGAEIVRVPKSTWDEIQLGYAITTWKAQGSQWPVAITLADPAGRHCDRAYWYTSISRAGKLCVLIGRRADIDKQCRKVSIARRQTFLARDLRDSWVQSI